MTEAHSTFYSRQKVIDVAFSFVWKARYSQLFFALVRRKPVSKDKRRACLFPETREQLDIPPIMA